MMMNYFVGKIPGLLTGRDPAPTGWIWEGLKKLRVGSGRVGSGAVPCLTGRVIHMPDPTREKCGSPLPGPTREKRSIRPVKSPGKKS